MTTTKKCVYACTHFIVWRYEFAKKTKRRKYKYMKNLIKWYRVFCAWPKKQSLYYLQISLPINLYVISSQPNNFLFGSTIHVPIKLYNNMCQCSLNTCNHSKFICFEIHMKVANLRINTHLIFVHVFFFFLQIFATSKLTHTFLS